MAKKKNETQVFLTREMILDTRDELKIEKVELTRGIVFVREMSGEEKDIWERSMMKRVQAPGAKEATYETTLDHYKAKLAVVTMCDEHGNLLFDMRDIRKLSKMMSASNLEKVVEAAQAINAISQKDKEEILGNSEADQQDNSTLGSAEK